LPATPGPWPNHGVPFPSLYPIGVAAASGPAAVWLKVALAAPVGWLRMFLGALGRALHFVADRTGIPVVVVTAVGLVLGVRAARRSGRFFVEVAVVVAALLAATKLGLLAW
jgi:hypothetical protein